MKVRIILYVLINIVAAGNILTAQTNGANDHLISGSNATSSCDTLHNITNTQSIAIYWADMVAPHDSGYLTGTNAYHDKAKAEKYNYTSAPKQLFAIRAYLHKTGTGNVTFNVWSAATSTVSAGVIPSSVIAYRTVGLGTLINGWNTIPLSYPITPPSVYFIGFTIPVSQGDTIAVATNDTTTGGGVANSGFEEWSNSEWINYSDPRDYNVPLSNYLFPIFCPVNSISEQENDANILISPNPGKGQFTLSVPIRANAEFLIRVTDFLGQTVYQEYAYHKPGSTITLDLSSLDKGVYIVTLSNGATGNALRKIMIE